MAGGVRMAGNAADVAAFQQHLKRRSSSAGADQVLSILLIISSVIRCRQAVLVCCK